MVDYLRFAKACKDAKEAMTTKPQSTTEPPDRIRLVKRGGAFDGHWYYPDAAIMPYESEFEYARVDRKYFCSCGGALTAEEYITHYFEMGHLTLWPNGSPYCFWSGEHPLQKPSLIPCAAAMVSLLVPVPLHKLHVSRFRGSFAGSYPSRTPVHLPPIWYQSHSRPSP